MKNACHFCLRSLSTIMLLMLFSLTIKAQVNPRQVNNKLLQKSVKSVLGTDEKINWQKVRVPDSLKSELQGEFKTNAKVPDSLFLGVLMKGAKKKYVITDIAPSRSDTFSYVLYLNESKEIIGIDVLKYRESYGYEIDYPFFREQFKGKQKSEEIIFGRTIRNISGATISARSLTYSVHDLLLIVNQITLP